MSRHSTRARRFVSRLAPLVLISAWFCLSEPVVADGLIYQLPPDGTTAVLEGKGAGEQSSELPKELENQLTPEAKARLTEKNKFQTTVTVSSVGRITRGGQACRWIELAMRSVDKTEPGDQTNHVLKLLIPEKFLKRGEDPLSHSILTLFNPKEVDDRDVEQEQGFNRIQYEIDRFRGVFPERLGQVRQLPRKTISTPAGTFRDCEMIAGVTEFDCPLLGEGRWAFKHDWQIALHPDAPFGVVAIQCRFAGSEFDEEGVTTLVKGTTQLTLSKVGRNAATVLRQDPATEKTSAGK